MSDLQRTERKTMIEDVLRMVRGRLSADACRVLFNLVEDLPEDAVVLDVCPGEGQSTIILSKAAEMTSKGNLKIISVDSHIVHPFAERPHESGTIMSFLTNLRTFRVMSRVIPVIGSSNVVSSLLPKRSVNLAVIQAPLPHLSYRDAIYAGIQHAQATIRRGGVIALPIPMDIDFEIFEEAAKSALEEGFQCTTNVRYFKAFTYKGVKDK